MPQGLWFDVGIKRYTTSDLIESSGIELWFDVGIKRYTTPFHLPRLPTSCGLM